MGIVMARKQSDGNVTTTGRGVISRKHASGRSTLLIHFVFEGVTVREPLGLDDTPKNRAYAERLRGEVVNKISRGEFVYIEAFPNSKRADRALPAASKDTVGAKLTHFLKTCEKAVARGNMSIATLITYRSIVGSFATSEKPATGHLMPKWGNHRIRDVSTSEMREWISLLEGTRKTINNILVPLRSVFDDAAIDRVIDASPLAVLPVRKILDKTATKSTFAPNPFNPQEVLAILEAAKYDRNMFQFAFFSGLRTSEYIALDWPCVDLAKGTAFVNKVRVKKTDQDFTKTEGSTRLVELHPLALSALQAQREATQLAGAHVFLLNGARWNGDKRVRLHWTAILERAGVAYRNPYQTRHTFATMMLALGEAPLRVAHLLGHVDTSMVTKHYARWIGGVGVDTITLRREWLGVISKLAPLRKVA